MTLGSKAVVCVLTNHLCISFVGTQMKPKKFVASKLLINARFNIPTICM